MKNDQHGLGPWQRVLLRLPARADFLVARKTAAAGALVRISKESRLLLSSVVGRPKGGRHLRPSLRANNLY